MTKMNRRIDETRMNQSKERTMDYVLNAINKEAKATYSWSRPRIALLSTLVLVIALVIMVTSSNISPPGTEPITINAYESEKLAEINQRLTVPNGPP